MLNVWRGPRQIFAECTECGSYGTANHAQVSVKMTPEISDAVERHTAHMMALRSHYTTAVGAIQRELENGSIQRDEAVSRVRSLYVNHLAKIQLATSALPSTDGKVTETVETCPWCGVASQAVVQTLSPDEAHPKFALASDAKPRPWPTAIKGGK